MKRDTLRLSQHQSIETGKDWNGRFFIAYSGGASVFIRGSAELRRFLKIPKSIPMRAALDSWLESLADMDRDKAAMNDLRAASAEVSGVELSWDPQAHDVDTGNTRMIT